MFGGFGGFAPAPPVDTAPTPGLLLGGARRPPPITSPTDISGAPPPAAVHPLCERAVAQRLLAFAGGELHEAARLATVCRAWHNAKKDAPISDINLVYGKAQDDSSDALAMAVGRMRAALHSMSGAQCHDLVARVLYAYVLVLSSRFGAHYECNLCMAAAPA